MQHELSWFKERKNKEVIRTFKGGTDETKIVISGEKTEDYCKYFHDLQVEGFEYRDTGTNIAKTQYDSAK